MRRSVFAALTLTFLLLIFSCATQEEEKARFVGKPTIKVRKMVVTELTFDEIDMLFTLSIENPNPFAVELDSYGYELSVEGSPFLSGTSDEGLSIPAGDSTSLSLPVSLGYDRLRETAQRLENKTKAAYRLDVSTEALIPGTGRSIALSGKKEGTFPVPVTPKVDVEDVIITRFGNTIIFLEFGIRVRNPNEFDVTVGSVAYDFSVNRRSWASGETGRTYRFDPEDSRNVYVPLELNYMEVGRTVVDLLMSGQELEYRIHGSSTVEVESEELSIPERIFEFDTSGIAAIVRP